MFEIEKLSLQVTNQKLVDFKKTAFATLAIELTNTLNIESITVAIGETVTLGKINKKPNGSLFFFQHTLPLKSGFNRILLPIPEHVAPNTRLPKCPTPAEAEGEIAPFRYVQIENFSGEVTLIRQLFFGNWDDNASHFECSDYRLNQIWDFCKYSIKATSCFDRYIDGQRERLPYEGDTYINQLGHFCCSPSFDLARASIKHLLEFPTWPTEWRLLMPIITRDFQLYSGENVDDLMANFNLLEEYINEDGLIEPFTLIPNNFDVAKDIRDIVDWPLCERDNYEFGAINLVPNAYLCGMYQALYELTLDSKFLQKKSQTRNSIRKFMMKDGRVVDNPNSDHTALHSAIFALYFDILEPDEVATHTNIIKERGMACSVYGAQFLLESCFLFGMSDYAIELMCSTGERSWFNMLNKGATITMEAWDDSFKPNQDWTHPWGAAPANIIPRYLCGLRPTKSGFAEAVIKPNPGSLEWFYYRVNTNLGEFIIEYKDNKYTYQIPEGCKIIEVISKVPFRKEKLRIL